jgi:hypothetical protein
MTLEAIVVLLVDRPVTLSFDVYQYKSVSIHQCTSISCLVFDLHIILTSALLRGLSGMCSLAFPQGSPVKDLKLSVPTYMDL